MSKLYVNTIAPQSGTDVNLEGSVKITGNLEVTGTLHAKTTDFIVSANSTTFGDAASDSLTFNASTGSVPNGFNFDSNTLVIDSSNNRIGIGVAAPTQALDVNGTVKATTFSGGSLSSTGDLTVGDDLLLQSDSAVLSFGLGDDVSLTHTNDVGIHLNAAMRLGFRDQGGEYIYSVSDGNLGVVAATSIDLKSPQIDIGEDDTSDVTINLLGSTNDMAIVYDESAKVLNIDSNTLAVDGANNRVGIGTAAPAVDLEIKAEHPKLLFQSSEGSGNGDGQIIFKSTDGTQLANIRCDATSNALNHFGISAGSGEDDLVIDGSGNIGINDTTPSHRLDVNGTLRSTGIATFDANVVVSVDADADDTTADSATGRISAGVGADLNLYHGGTNSYVVNTTGDLIIATEGGSGAGIILDAEDDTIEVKYSGVLGATFDGDGLDLVTGDAYQINGASVLNATTLGSAVVNSSLTSVGTLTTLTVDNITINGTEIDSDGDLTVDVAGDLALSAEGGNVTMDDGTITVFDFDVDNVALKIMDDADTGDYFSIGVAANGATTLTTVDDDGAAANLIITADGTVDIDSAGTMTLDSGANINLEPAAGSHILLDGTIQVDAGVVTGATSVTVGSTVVTDDSIVMTPSTDDTVTISAATNGALTITTVDTAAAAANIQITADGTFEVDATTITMDSSGTVVLDAASTAAGAIDINSAGGMDVDVADEINIATTSADGHISLVSAHTSGVALHIDANADAGSIVDIDAGVLDIDVTGAATLDAASLTVTSDTVTFTSANANDPIVTIENTTADAAAPRLKFNKNRGADAVDADDVGDIQFWSYDDGTPSVQQYAGVLAEVHDATSGEESGKLTLQVASHDGGLESGIILTGGSADAEVDVTIGAGADSLTTISGDLDIPNGGFALGSDASGDMYYRNASGVLTRIAVGSNNHVLTLDGAVPGWEAAGSAAVAADDIDAGDAAVGISTTSGAITIDSNASSVTVDGHTGVTVQSSNSGNITLDSVADVVLDADGDQITMKFGGAAGQIDFTNENSGDGVIQQKVDAKDLVIKQFDGTEVARFTDGGNVEIKDDLYLKSDDCVIHFGLNSDIILDHRPDSGLRIQQVSETTGEPTLSLKNTGNFASGPGIHFAMDNTSGEGDGDILGFMKFFGSDSGDVIQAFATIEAQSVDVTDGTEDGGIIFKTLVAGSDTNLLDINNTLDGGVAVANGLSVGGLTTIKPGSNTAQLKLEQNNATDGWSIFADSSNGFLEFTRVGSDSGLKVSMEHDGGHLGIRSDNAAIKFGADGDVTLTHVHNTGLLLSDASGIGTTKLMFGDAACFIQQQADGQLGIDADSIINVTAPTLDIDASTAVTIDTASLTATLDTATFTSANADDPLIIIKNTTNDASGARLRFVKDKGAAGAINDIAGVIEFYADDANQEQVKFASITSLVKEHTNGQEGGELVLEVASHNGTPTPGLSLMDGSEAGEVDVILAGGADSVTTVSGDLVVTTTTTYTAASVHNFSGDDALSTIPITKTYIVVDANGSARQGMRFGGAGVAGQILYVKNSGGENIAFHPTEGTALITTTASTDTIAPGAVHHFVSDGAGWYLIGPAMVAGG